MLGWPNTGPMTTMPLIRVTISVKATKALVALRKSCARSGAVSASNGRSGKREFKAHNHPGGGSECRRNVMEQRSRIFHHALNRPRQNDQHRQRHQNDLG